MAKAATIYRNNTNQLESWKMLILKTPVLKILIYRKMSVTLSTENAGIVK